MNTTLLNVIKLIDSGAKVRNHGGRVTTITTYTKSGKAKVLNFPRKVVQLATHYRFLTRQAKRDAKGAMDAMVTKATADVAAGTTSNDNVLEAEVVPSPVL
jgi:hypothetical protein